MELLGSKNLTNSELLAIIIKNGTRNLNCVQVAQNIFMSNNNISNIGDLEYLSMLSLQELQNFEGIGKIKAIQIKAALELSRRLKKETIINDKFKITNPNDIYNLVCNSYDGCKLEILKIIILNKQNKVLSVVDIGSSQIDKVEVDIKQILSEPIKQMACSIALCHNHPGGTLNPSRQDINFTKKIMEYSKIFNINLLDHVIIADNKFISMKQLGCI